MHEQFMKLAIAIAKNGAGHTYKNPLVGAVIVKENVVIASGAHLHYGDQHAEKNAIDACTTPEKLFNSTLYVTLEPCAHFGKQPPCTSAIIASGIRRVIIGQLDPNPLVAGKGKKVLEQAGIDVIEGVLGNDVRALNPFYNYFYEQGRPFIALKQAISLDGKIALKNQRTTLTSSTTHAYIVHERSAYQAILVGSQTVLTDNPTLHADPAIEYPPMRIVLDRRGRIFTEPKLKLFNDNYSEVVIFTTITPVMKLPDHVKVISQATMTIDSVLSELTRLGVQSLYVEGGATIHDAFLMNDKWDELICYLALKLLGGNSLPSFSSRRPSLVATELALTTSQMIGPDIRLTARRYPHVHRINSVPRKN